MKKNIYGKNLKSSRNNLIYLKTIDPLLQQTYNQLDESFNIL